MWAVADFGNIHENLLLLLVLLLLLIIIIIIITVIIIINLTLSLLFCMGAKFGRSH